VTGYTKLGTVRDVKFTFTKEMVRKVKELANLRLDEKAVKGTFQGFFVAPEFIEMMERDLAVAAARKTDRLLMAWRIRGTN
jgi:hypothetical protein